MSSSILGTWNVGWDLQERVEINVAKSNIIFRIFWGGKYGEFAWLGGWRRVGRAQGHSTKMLVNFGATVASLKVLIAVESCAVSWCCCCCCCCCCCWWWWWWWCCCTGCTGCTCCCCSSASSSFCCSCCSWKRRSWWWWWWKWRSKCKCKSCKGKQINHQKGTNSNKSEQTHFKKK